MPEKFEEEIAEIVERRGAGIGPRTTLGESFSDLRDRVRSGIIGQLATAFDWLTPRRVGGLGAVLLLAGVIARQPIVAILAVSLLLFAYLLSILRGSESFKSATGYERKWRGQAIKDDGNTGLPGKLWRWFRKRRK